MQFSHSILSVSIKATSLMTAYDLVGYGDAKVTAADAAVKGVALQTCTEIGQAIGVLVIGTVRVKAVGAITAGTKVVSAAAGGVQAATGASVNVFGQALTTAADGEYLDILIR